VVIEKGAMREATGPSYLTTWELRLTWTCEGVSPTDRRACDGAESMDSVTT